MLRTFFKQEIQEKKMEGQYRELQEYDQYSNEFGLIDFLDEAVFDQFVDLIRGEGIDQSHLPVNGNFVGTQETYDCNNIVGLSNFEGGFMAPPANPLDLFDFEVDAATVVHGGDHGLQNGGHKEMEGEDHEMIDDEESSGTTTTTTTATPPPPKEKNKKVDRSRTLISERRRRSRMKDKLYALRSLVPNITKMDKASIVGDAVLYVKDLQTQAKKLRAEVSNLEQSLARGGNNNKLQGRSTIDDQNTKKINATNFYPITKKINLKMDVFQVEERGFYVRVVCNKGKGVAMLLYKALESLTNFTVQTSNLASSAGNYVFTFTLQIMEQEMDINLSNLKLWIGTIFLNKGFEFETSQSI